MLLAIWLFTFLCACKSNNKAEPQASEEAEIVAIQPVQEPPLAIIPITKNIALDGFFSFIDALVRQNNTISSYKLSENLLLRANPWILDTLVNTDYYYQMSLGNFVFRQPKLIVLKPGDTILIPGPSTAAMLKLGPSGYPFEHFFTEILRAQGYSAQTGQLLMGKCIKHEMDVVAENGTDVVFVECKYHAQPGTITDVKVPLYIHARFHDLQRSPDVQRDLNGRTLQCKIATNTRFSDDAMTYGRCAGLDLVAWDYPVGKSLREIIDKAGLHPITCLSSLARHEKTKLLNQGVVLCSTLLDTPQILGKIHITATRQKTILQEVRGLCSA